MSDIDAVSCATDPRCVAKEHYVPPDGADDLSIGIPDHERGTIKLWQMLLVDYVRLLSDWADRSGELDRTVYLILGCIGDQTPKKAGVTNLSAKSGSLRESESRKRLKLRSVHGRYLANNSTSPTRSRTGACPSPSYLMIRWKRRSYYLPIDHVSFFKQTSKLTHSIFYFTPRNSS
jgi:hypothetical protein